MFSCVQWSITFSLSDNLLSQFLFLVNYSTKLRFKCEIKLLPTNLFVENLQIFIIVPMNREYRQQRAKNTQIYI